MKRWSVVLVDTDYEPGRVYGEVKSYRWRRLAERRRQSEAAADVRLGQAHLGEWQVRDLDAPNPNPTPAPAAPS